MQSNILGLVEMVLVFSIAVGWGIFELLSLNWPRKPTPPPPQDDEPPT